jgi:hypothetical protein
VNNKGQKERRRRKKKEENFISKAINRKKKSLTILNNSLCVRLPYGVKPMD